MKTAACVLGPVPPDRLGHCQIHEHIFVRATPAAEKNPALRIDDEAHSAEELRRYRAAGGGSLVDAQPFGAGRDALALARLSRETGVAVVASTGFHLPGFYRPDSWLNDLDEGGLRALFESELAEGMLPWEAETLGPDTPRTGVRAGLVKAAIPAEGPVGRFRTLLRAAAGAAAARRAPLMLHTEKGQRAVEAAELCFSLGVAPEGLIVCHADRQADDFAPHEALARLGVYLDYDTIGRFRYHSDEAELRLILHMLEKGLGGRLLLSLDTTAARLRSYGGSIGLDYLFVSFLPALRAAGVHGDALEAMTRVSPRRALTPYSTTEGC